MMMDEILISIKPKWVTKILSGEKKGELRKTRPSSAEPFKCFIYESGTGCVVGEFVCKKVVTLPWDSDRHKGQLDYLASLCCIDIWEMADYLQGKDGLVWYISDVKEYENPRPLLDFLKMQRSGRMVGFVPVKRPPQSWMYVIERRAMDGNQCSC